MNIIGKCLKPEEFKKYVENKFFGYLPANKIVLHHTYRPNLKTWKGKDTIYALKRYYESKDWNAGPHLFIASESIWLFSDMRKNGIHAGKGNWRSIGIEMVGDFTKEKPKGTQWELVKYAIIVLNKKLGLKSENIKFHRDYSNTQCPGLAINKSWVIEELLNYSVIPDNTFIKEKTKKVVYFVKNNIKYPIPDWQTFIFFWGTPEKIKTLLNAEIDNIKTGGKIPSVKNLKF